MTTQAKPVVELKGIKVLSSMSQETNCYEATLYVDGVKWGSVGNAGHGGCDDLHLVAGRTWDEVKALNALITATYDPLPNQYGEPLTMDLELLCGVIVDDFIVEKAAKSVTKGKVAFFKTPPVEGVPAPLYTFPTKGHRPEAVIQLVRNHHPEAVILNELSGAELVAAYSKAA